MNERYAFIIGAPKCGTSSLYAWLSAHPEVSGSRPKETFFFMDAGYPLRRMDGGFHAQGAAGFERFFNDASSKDLVRLEATTHTIYQREMPAVFGDLFPSARAIAVIRDPAKRILSAFTYTKQNLAAIDTQLTFERYVDLLLRERHDEIRRHVTDPRSAEIMANELTLSDYLPHLQRWRTVFRDRLRIVQFEQMVQQPAVVTRDLVAWLGLEQAAVDTIDFRPMNPTRSFRWPAVHRAARAVRLAMGPSTMFRFGRSFYYHLQHRESPKEAGELAGLERLQQYYAPLHMKLANEAPVDLSLWGTPRA